MNEEKHKLGTKELEILDMMFKRWVRADFNWALSIIEKQGSSGEDDEWDFLRREWIDKLESWMGPWVSRLRKMNYITDEDVSNFGSEAAETINMMLAALYALGGNNKNE